LNVPKINKNEHEKHKLTTEKPEYEPFVEKLNCKPPTEKPEYQPEYKVIDVEYQPMKKEEQFNKPDDKAIKFFEPSERKVSNFEPEDEKLFSEVKSMRSLFDDSLSIKPYSDCHNLNFEDLKTKNEEKVNNSMMENLKKAHYKKPPLPGFNSYKNMDKSVLNKIQKILKNKDTKKLNYASSEESN
jgi:hypothetical protein